ncbi:MAG: molybdopterin dinucleotide binding domain-containing protein [Pseudomonadota bacterium]
MKQRVSSQLYTKSARLSAHMAEPYVEIHPADAEAAGIEPATLARVESPHGTVVLRAIVTDRTPRGSLFAPMHWTAITASRGRIDAVVGAATDPLSGQPESKAQPVRIAPFRPAWHGFALSRRAPRPGTAYWARARGPDHWRLELAHDGVPEDWNRFALALFGLDDGVPAISITDSALPVARLAFTANGRVDALLLTAPGPVEAARGPLAAAFDAGADAVSLLSGRPDGDRPDTGPIVCSCHGIGANTIAAAVAAGGLTSIEAVGAATAAGTACGSCRPEIAALIAACRPDIAAE